MKTKILPQFVKDKRAEIILNRFLRLATYLLSASPIPELSLTAPQTLPYGFIPRGTCDVSGCNVTAPARHVRSWITSCVSVPLESSVSGVGWWVVEATRADVCLPNKSKCSLYRCLNGSQQTLQTERVM